MKKEFSSNLSWNTAAVTGLIMAAVTIVLALILSLCSKIGGVGGSAFSFILSLVKICVCIWVFGLIMKRFYDTVENDYVSLQRYGMKVALFSSILVAAWSALDILVFHPGQMEESIAEMQSQMSGMLDSNSLAAMEDILPKLPVISFFSNLIYCFIWGWILATVYARRLCPINPFAGGNPFQGGNPFASSDNQPSQSDETPEEQEAAVKDTASAAENKEVSVESPAKEKEAGTESEAGKKEDPEGKPEDKD